MSSRRRAVGQATTPIAGPPAHGGPAASYDYDRLFPDRSGNSRSPGPVTGAGTARGYRLVSGGVAGAVVAVFGWTVAGFVSVSGCSVPPVMWASGPLSVNVASWNRVAVGAGAVATSKAGAASVSPVGIEVET